MTQANQEELDRLISRIENHRLSLKLTHSRFATRFAKHIGSHKTWEFRLLARNWGELNADKWLPKLRTFVAEIEGSVGEQEIFESLPIVKHAVYLFDTLQTKTNDRRCAMLIGPKGCGKTLALRYVQRKNDYGPQFISANETWKDSRMRIAAALGQAVNSTVTKSASETFQHALDRLKEHPMDIFIDEAHEGGVLLIKLCKSIINETRSRLILGIYPTAWRRLLNGSNDAYEEAQQLLRRTIRPIRNDWMKGINHADMAAWCAAVNVPMTKAQITDLLPLVRQHGNLSLLADAHERALLLAAEDDKDVETELLIEQIYQVCGEVKQSTEEKK